MNCLEDLYIQLYKGLLIDEENVGEYSPLCEMLYDIQLKQACM